MSVNEQQTQIKLAFIGAIQRMPLTDVETHELVKEWVNAGLIPTSMPYIENNYTVIEALNRLSRVIKGK